MKNEIEIKIGKNYSLTTIIRNNLVDKNNMTHIYFKQNSNDELVYVINDYIMHTRVNNIIQDSFTLNPNNMNNWIACDKYGNV